MNKTFNFNYKNRNKSIKEQLRNIKITSYIMLPIILIFEIIGAILIGFTATNTGGLILIVIGLIILFVHDIELAYKIITTDWENEEINKDKMLWVGMTIILQGAIASIIFVIKAEKALNKIEETKEGSKIENNI